MSTNSILILGPTGVGKSFLCNKIFETCGNHATSFLSSSSIESTTKEIQSGTINYSGNTFAILDFPGIYDVSSTNTKSSEVEAENTCKMITALQNCESVKVIIFCYSGPRFPLPLKIWYDRIRSIISGCPNLNILLLENKCPEDSDLMQVKRNMELHEMLGHSPNEPTIPYTRFKYYSPGTDAGNDVRKILNMIQPFVPVKVTNPVIPDICYKQNVESPSFEEVISETQKDEGHMVVTSRQEPYCEERMVWDGDFGKIFGMKVKIRFFIFLKHFKSHMQITDNFIMQTIFFSRDYNVIGRKEQSQNNTGLLY